MSDYPVVAIERIWDHGSRDEVVRGLGSRNWRITDLKKAVENEPVYMVPIAFLDLRAHNFDMDGGLIDFAIHARHVNESNADDPIIVDQWGAILDGRHRLVRALLEGKTMVPAKKIPDGTDCTFNS